MNQSLKVASIGLFGVGVGFAIGYKVTEKRLAARFDERLDAETADMKEFYTNVKQKYDTPEEAAAALIPQPTEEPEDPRVKTQKVQYNKIVKAEQYDGDPLDEFQEGTNEGCEIDEVVHKNIFDAQPPGIPRLITQEDFMTNETGYEQATLTFYAKGAVLTDQRDEVIDNAEDVVGQLFESNFGEGSSDPSTVHVRNDKIQMEFEVVRSGRSYEEDVLGQEDTETPSHRRHP
jgi:hypothetical protein